MPRLIFTSPVCRTFQRASCALVLVAAGTSAAIAAEKTSILIVPKTQIKYEKINPAISMATVTGNRSTGAHGTFGKFPPKFITPFHRHSGAYHGIVLKGVMTNPFKGEKNPKQMAAGSYWYVPANAVHATACVSKVPCEFYFHAGSKFDFMPAK